MHDARYRQPEALLDHGQKCFPADLLDRQLDRLFGSAQHPPENSCEFAPGTKVFAAFSAGDCRVIAPNGTAS